MLLPWLVVRQKTIEKWMMMKVTAFKAEVKARVLDRGMVWVAINLRIEFRFRYKISLVRYSDTWDSQISTYQSFIGHTVCRICAQRFMAEFYNHAG
jgi:hypothetical protein